MPAALFLLAQPTSSTPAVTMANTAVPLKADFLDADVPGMVFPPGANPLSCRGFDVDQANHGSTD